MLCDCGPLKGFSLLMGFLLMCSLGALAGCENSSASRGPSLMIMKVNCSAGDEAQTTFQEGIEDVLENVHAFAHDTQYRQEQVRQVELTAQSVPGGTEVTAACSGASYVEFVQEVWQ